MGEIIEFRDFAERRNQKEPAPSSGDTSTPMEPAKIIHIEDKVHGSVSLNIAPDSPLSRSIHQASSPELEPDFEIVTDCQGGRLKKQVYLSSFFSQEARDHVDGHGDIKGCQICLDYRTSQQELDRLTGEAEDTHQPDPYQ